MCRRARRIADGSSSVLCENAREGERGEDLTTPFKSSLCCNGLLRGRRRRRRRGDSGRSISRLASNKTLPGVQEGRIRACFEENFLPRHSRLLMKIFSGYK